MTTRRAAAAIALLLATLTACSGSVDDQKPTPSHSRPATSKAPEPGAPASPSPTPVAPASFGDSYEWQATNIDGEDTAGTLTVIGYEQPIDATYGDPDEDFGTEGYVWSALEVKSCITEGSWLASPFSWTLAYEDGTRIEPSDVGYDDFPKPEFPDTKVRADHCVRGKIVYPVPGDDRPATVLYSFSDADDPAEWTVPAS